MAITLYYSRYSRAERVRWLLEELGVDYTLESASIEKGLNETAEYKAVHPLGKVPALRIDDRVMLESGAMCIHLADRYTDKGLAVPIDSSERAEYLQWILFACTELEPPLTWHYYHTSGWEEAKRDPTQAAYGLEQFNLAAAVIADHLSDREYMVDNRFTTADIVVGAVLGMARGLGILPPSLRDYGKRVGTRPAARAARAD